MRTLSFKLLSPWLLIVFLTAALAVSMSMAMPFPQDDHFFYQKFIETLAQGKLDLSILGFHGSDFLAVPLHWLTQSSISQIEFQALCALLIPLVAFLAGRALFGSDEYGVLLCGAISMMPFVLFVYLRGWTGSAYMLLMLLTVYAAAKEARWTWIAWSLAMLTKPFAFALLPLLLVLSPKSSSHWRRFEQVILGLGVVVAYMFVQYIQVGHLIVGVHPGVTESNVWQGPMRMLLNAAHTLQILFSVHNFYYPDPSLTGFGNMLHTTPVLMFLGLFYLLVPSTNLSERRLQIALLIGAIMGIGMNIPLDHMDHFYMEAGVLLLVIAAIPLLKKFPLWIPITLATLHFQWFYFYLQYRDPFQLGLFFFAVPVVIDVFFVLFCVYHWHRVWKCVCIYKAQ